MTHIEKSIDVKVPVHTAYDQWTQRESFPQFMEGIEEVHQLDDKHIRWRANMGGTTQEWDSEIIEQIPDQRVAWRAVSGPEHSGAVTFQPLGPDETRVTLSMSYEPEGIIEKAGDVLGVVERQVEGNLKRFKAFIEAHGQEPRTMSSLGSPSTPNLFPQTVGH